VIRVILVTLEHREHQDQKGQKVHKGFLVKKVIKVTLVILGLKVILEIRGQLGQRVQ
jgi:hypothetical protein